MDNVTSTFKGNPHMPKGPPETTIKARAISCFLLFGPALELRGSMNQPPPKREARARAPHATCYYVGQKANKQIIKFCIFLLVADLLYFSVKFLQTQSEYIPEVRPRKFIPQHPINSVCRSLFSGKRIPMRPSKRKRLQKERALNELLKDCAKLRSQHGYDDKPVSEEELQFPLAFSIKMHTAPLQVERLLRTIYRPHNFYCIHVDAKASDEIYSIIERIGGCLKNVAVLKNRVNVVYGTIRHLVVEFACMRSALESDVKWKYYINLTGQEFVLRTNLELVKILTLFNGANDVESYDFTQMHRIALDYILVNDKIVERKTNRKIFKNIKLYKGSTYGMFTRAFVEFVLNDNVAIDFYHWLNNTRYPEETIWPTLNRLPFAPGGFPPLHIKHDTRTHASRAVIWEYETERCHGKFIRGVCVFGSGDLPFLRSRPEIVANKFYEEFDPAALDCLEQWVNHRAYSGSTEELNWYYYMKLPQVKYYSKLMVSKRPKTFLQYQKARWLKNVDYNNS